MTPRPPRKAALAANRSKKPPSFTAIHKSLGECQVVGVRLGDSGAWLADVVFGQTKRTLQLTQDHWLTPVSELVRLAAYFPQAKPVKAKVSAALDEVEEEREPEMGQETADEDDGNVAIRHRLESA